jgi:hypothetical protein
MTDQSTATPSAARTVTLVTVTDVDMPMSSMVRFMVRWAIASIPALIILAVIGLLIGVAFSALAGIAALVSSGTHL